MLVTIEKEPSDTLLQGPIPLRKFNKVALMKEYPYLKLLTPLTFLSTIPEKFLLVGGQLFSACAPFQVLRLFPALLLFLRLEYFAQFPKVALMKKYQNLKLWTPLTFTTPEKFLLVGGQLFSARAPFP